MGDENNSSLLRRNLADDRTRFFDHDVNDTNDDDADNGVLALLLFLLNDGGGDENCGIDNVEVNVEDMDVDVAAATRSFLWLLLGLLGL